MQEDDGDAELAEEEEEWDLLGRKQQKDEDRDAKETGSERVRTLTALSTHCRRQRACEQVQEAEEC